MPQPLAADGFPHLRGQPPLGFKERQAFPVGDERFDALPLDLIVNDDAVWMTDLKPLRFVKLDFKGTHLYEWMVPSELPDGYLEVHTFSVDSEGNLYGGDNQYGRTQKFVAKDGADPKLLIKAPWRAR